MCGGVCDMLLVVGVHVQAVFAGQLLGAITFGPLASDRFSDVHPMAHSLTLHARCVTGTAVASLPFSVSLSRSHAHAPPHLLLLA